MNQMTIDGIEIRHFLSLFEENAGAYRDKAAVKGMGKCHTYGELDAMSDTVGHYLIEQGVKRGDVVLIDMERHIDVFPAILGIWKARCAFAYVDGKTPAAQKAVITESCHPSIRINAPIMEMLAGKTFRGDPAPAMPVGELEDLAWILLTSGTCGHSKGVLISHKCLAVQFASFRVFGASSDDVQSMLASFSFMSAMAEGISMLAVGGTVHMIPREIRRSLDG